MAKENEEEQINEGADSETVGLKDQEKGDGETKEWDKVAAIVKAAQEACDSGTPFPEVLATLIETLTALQKETGQKLGGLGVGGPEMDLPDDSEGQGAPSEEEEQ